MESAEYSSDSLYYQKKGSSDTARVRQKCGYVCWVQHHVSTCSDMFAYTALSDRMDCNKWRPMNNYDYRMFCHK